MASLHLQAYLDHIVVTAPELDAGIRHVETALGVSLTPGGKHPRMGTHNALLRLGESAYLEVIAPDPDAPAPAWPRWFDLDRLEADAPPRLAGWVIRTDDIQAASTDYSSVFGDVFQMHRDDAPGQMTLRADGCLPLDGAAPVLIEWQEPRHPAQSLPDTGCSLLDLQVFCPEPEQLHGILTATGLQQRPRVQWSGQEPAHLLAFIDTPAGRCQLGDVIE